MKKIKKKNIAIIGLGNISKNVADNSAIIYVG